jgi:nitric oxide reductase subunit B
MQTWASVEHGYWYARSAEFLQTDLMHTLRWMRVPGDTLFAAGVVSLVLFVVGLATGGSLRRDEFSSPSASHADTKELHRTGGSAGP